MGDEEGGEAPEKEAGAQHHPPPACQHHGANYHSIFMPTFGEELLSLIEGYILWMERMWVFSQIHSLHYHGDSDQLDDHNHGASDQCTPGDHSVWTGNW